MDTWLVGLVVVAVYEQGVHVPYPVADLGPRHLAGVNPQILGKIVAGKFLFLLHNSGHACGREAKALVRNPSDVHAVI